MKIFKNNNSIRNSYIYRLGENSGFDSFGDVQLVINYAIKRITHINSVRDENFDRKYRIF